MKKPKRPESIPSKMRRAEMYLARAKAQVGSAERLVKEAFEILARS